MAYFMSCFNSDKNYIEDFKEIFKEVTPKDGNNTSITISRENIFTESFNVEKGVNDILIENTSSGSWLLLIGTPLIQDISEAGKQLLLKEFLENPKDVLSRGGIDGQFASFAFNSKNRELVVATDMSSTIPVFYSESSVGTFFSSTELALAKLLQPELEPFGFAQAIFQGVTWGSQTRFKTIKKMLPCEVIYFNREGFIRRETYWNPNEESPWEGGFDEVLERWCTILSGSVKEYWKNTKEDKILTDFTAGEDARLLLAQCHALKIPYQAWVSGFPGDIDVEVAKQAAAKTGFDLNFTPLNVIEKGSLLADAINIVLDSDGYGQFFKNCLHYVFINNKHQNTQKFIHFTGIPGGTAFRGEYYMRGLALFPSRALYPNFDHLIKFKFLLDFLPGLLRYPDQLYLDRTYQYAQQQLKDVEKFSDGIKIDHLIRVLQTSVWSLIYKKPIYLPYATNLMTRSTYNLPAKYKRGGRLTKAVTEKLFPEIAYLKTQHGVPTIRKTLKRSPLFLPEHLSLARKVGKGFVRRVMSLQQSNPSIQSYLRSDYNQQVIDSLFNNDPYSKWFHSSETMVTGHLYNPSAIDSILQQAQEGRCKNLNVLSRVISNELGCRWVYRDL